MKGLFLDTATQIARHWHSDSERKEISEQLDARGLYCSHYVKCQYKATLLNSIIILHNLLLRFQDMLKALRESTRFENREIAGGALTPSVQKRVEMLGLWILHEYDNYESQMLRLEDMIEDAWECLFYDKIRLPLIDKTKCQFAENAPQKGLSGAFKLIECKCTKADPNDCIIDEFWNDHKIHLEALSNMEINKIKAEPKDNDELATIKREADSLLKENNPYGKRCTVHLSDVVICLESTYCPENVAVHSINKKHFRPLGEVLGVECEP